MYLESKNFIVRKLETEDKDNIKALEEARPWAKGILKDKELLYGKDRFDYFEHLYRKEYGSHIKWGSGKGRRVKFSALMFQ
ncbi:MAG: hypothetical protein IJC76_08085 [Lachnospiraceae bacterium]|nr:hypothetical protein [Lachnospiraceae bacterium]